MDERFADTQRARLFETQLRRIVAAHGDVPRWQKWWDLEMVEAKKLLDKYGVQRA